MNAKILHKPEQVLIVTTIQNSEQVKPFEDMGVNVEIMKGSNDKVDMSQVIAHLADLEINQVLVESGPTLAGSMMETGLIDELLIYTAPVIMGSSGRPLLKINIEEMSKRLHINPISNKPLGKDWRLRALVNK